MMLSPEGAEQNVACGFIHRMWKSNHDLVHVFIVPPRWGLDVLMDLFPGALPQADMWLPLWGGIAIVAHEYDSTSDSSVSPVQS
jgi:hypothetical protein